MTYSKRWAHRVRISTAKIKPATLRDSWKGAESMNLRTSTIWRSFSSKNGTFSFMSTSRATRWFRAIRCSIYSRNLPQFARKKASTDRCISPMPGPSGLSDRSLLKISTIASMSTMASTSHDTLQFKAINKYLSFHLIFFVFFVLIVDIEIVWPFWEEKEV